MLRQNNGSLQGRFELAPENDGSGSAWVIRNIVRHKVSEEHPNRPSWNKEKIEIGR